MRAAGYLPFAGLADAGLAKIEKSLPPLWYLVAWDAARAGFRHFRMDRISNPTVVNGTRFRQRHVPFDQDVCPCISLRQ